MTPRDIAIRTILGEALGEGPQGWAAVAHVLQNRAADPRWPASVQDVALQPKQFSAWNAGPGGNDLVAKYGPETDPYRRVAAIYDQVAAGAIPDPTGGATHYYSPAGMDALVASGAQTNRLPVWLEAENYNRGEAPVQIGGHIFTGHAAGAPTLGAPAVPDAPPAVDTEEPTGIMGALAAMGGAIDDMPARQEPLALAPMRNNLQLTARNNPYAGFFRGLING